MRWYRSPLPAPRPRELAQRLVHEARRGFARDLARERHARGHGGVGGDAIEGAQLIGAEAQDVVEAGIGSGEGKAEVELGPPAQHACGELVRQATIPLGEAREVAIARGRERGAATHRPEQLERRPARGRRFLNPASPRRARTAAPPRGAASGPPGKPRGPPRPRVAWRAPWRRDRAPPRVPRSSGCRPRPAPA